jgi:hypothetical protein
MPEDIVANGTPNPTPAPAGEGTPNPTPSPNPNPAPAGNQAGDWEREKTGLIRETQKERVARQKAETEFATLKAQHEIAVKRINALAGVNPKSPSEAEDEEIKAAFKAKFPELASLTADDISAIREMRAQQSSLKAGQDAMWRKHTTQVLNSVHDKVSERLGGGELSERMKSTLRREYVSFLEENQATGKDFITRHENGDETLLDEFVDAYLKEWQEPIRRSVTSTEVNRQRPLPNGKGGNVKLSGTPKKIDFKDPKAVEDAAVEAFKSYGGVFGNG